MQSISGFMRCFMVGLRRVGKRLFACPLIYADSAWANDKAVCPSYADSSYSVFNKKIIKIRSIEGENICVCIMLIQTTRKYNLNIYGIRLKNLMVNKIKKLNFDH
jgi:hypothetical protein